MFYKGVVVHVHGKLHVEVELNILFSKSLDLET